MKKLVGILTVLLLITATQVMAAAIYECDFESPTYSTGTINGQNNWGVSATSGYFGDVLDSTDTDWGGRTGDQFLAVHDFRAYAQAPNFNTSGEDIVQVSFDMRPAGPSTSTSVTHGAKYLIKDVAGNIMVDTNFRRNALNSGYVEVNGVATALTWAYVDKDTVLHVNMIIDQTVAGWTVTTTVDNQPGVAVALNSASTPGTPVGRIDLRGGAQITGTYADAVCYDELSVVPEPATCALLGIGSALALLRRRGI